MIHLVRAWVVLFLFILFVGEVGGQNIIPCSILGVGLCREERCDDDVLLLLPCTMFQTFAELSIHHPSKGMQIRSVRADIEY